MQTSDKQLNTKHWMVLLILIIVIKMVIFSIDRHPMFFLGDSHSYVTTSLTGWIPLDRSFVYGFIIRLVSVPFASLNYLIAAQVCAGIISSFLIAYSLIKFFSVNRKLSYLLSILCVIEPLQLLYERYVMTETIALLVFSIYMLSIFFYIENKNILLTLLVQVLGTLLISLRLSLLPLVMVNCVILPFIAIPILVNNELSEKFSLNNYFRSKYYSLRAIGIISLHLILSILSVYLLHDGYKKLNGFLSEKPPAYLYQSGIFLLANWSPIVKPFDFSRPGITHLVFDNLQYDLQDRHKRSSQHWGPGGIIDNLNKAISDKLEADKVAKVTAMNALKRDPLALATLSIKTFKDYFNRSIIHGSMTNDVGNRPLPEELLDVLKYNYNLSAEQLPFTNTITKYYYFNLWPWYLLLLFLPLICIVNLFLCSASINKYVFVVLLAATEIVVVATALVEGPTIRYLHPAAWLAFLVLGPFMNSVLNLKNN